MPPSKLGKLLPQSWRKKIEAKQKPHIAILNLHGMIASTGGGPRFGGQKPLSIHTTEKLITQAFNTKRLEAVFLSINSPGGSAVQSELIADFIGQKSAETKVPVISFVEDVAASGGYWLATAAPTIYASKSSIVGSIGVISQSFGLHKAIEKLGIERRTMTAGESKAFSDPFKPLEEKDTIIIKSILEALHENFKNQVKKARQDKLKVADDKIFSGEVWVGEKAVEIGLIDGVDTVHNFIQSQFGGHKKVTVVRISQPKPWPFSGFGSEFMGFEQTAFAHHLSSLYAQNVDQKFFENFKI